jgi:hypothetical protein
MAGLPLRLKSPKLNRASLYLTNPIEINSIETNHVKKIQSQISSDELKQSNSTFNKAAPNSASTSQSLTTFNTPDETRNLLVILPILD